MSVGGGLELLHKAGTIVELPITEGDPIQAGAPIATIKSPEPS